MAKQKTSHVFPSKNRNKNKNKRQETNMTKTDGTTQPDTSIEPTEALLDTSDDNQITSGSAQAALLSYFQATKCMSEGYEAASSLRITHCHLDADDLSFDEFIKKLIEDIKRLAAYGIEDLGELDQLYDHYRDWESNQEKYEYYHFLSIGFVDDAIARVCMVAEVADNVRELQSGLMASMIRLGKQIKHNAPHAEQFLQRYCCEIDKWTYILPLLQEYHDSLFALATAQVPKAETRAEVPNQNALRIPEGFATVLKNQNSVNDGDKGSAAGIPPNVAFAPVAAASINSQLKQTEKNIIAARSLVEHASNVLLHCSRLEHTPRVKNKVKTRGTPNPNISSQDPGRTIQQVQVRRRWTFEDADLYGIWRQIFPLPMSRNMSSDLAWDDFLRVITSEPMCFQLRKTPHAGVEHRFVRPAMEDSEQMTIVVHKPHGNGLFQRNYVWTIRTQMRKRFDWQAHDFVLEEK